MNDVWIRRGFLLAGLYNLGIVLFSRGFSDVLGGVDPLFSSAGCILILLWGLAYMATRSVYAAAPMLVGVFCVEKVFYAQHWARWLLDEGTNLAELGASDPLTASFFAIYGLGDGVFALFFGAVAWTHRGAASAT